MNSQLIQALVRLRKMILRGEMSPGQKMTELPLAQALGMSRVAVRQALPILAHEGLLSEHENHEYVVRGFSASDIRDAIDLRGLMEGMAARRVAEQGASMLLVEELRACLSEGDRILHKGYMEENDEADYAEMNANFHDLLVREAHSPIIEQALERISRIPFAGPQALAFEQVSLERVFGVLHFAHRQHHNIVDALERGESARVEALLREHINPAKESLNLPELQGEARAFKPLSSFLR